MAWDQGTKPPPESYAGPLMARMRALDFVPVEK